MPTIRWTINQQKLLSRKKKKSFSPDPEVIEWFGRVLEYVPTTDKENVMMDSFLRGFGEDLKNKWMEGTQVVSIDISDELKDLLKVYTDSEEHLKKQEEQSLEILRQYMKRYLDKQEERKKVSDKLNSLKQKIEDGKKPPCDNEDEEE